MNLLILAKQVLDVFVLAVMSYVGLRTAVSSSHVMKDEDLSQLRHLWMPSILAGGFMYVLALVNSAADFLGLTPWSYFVDTLSFLSIFVCLVFAIGMYRFTKFVEQFERKKKEAKTEISEDKLEEIAERLESQIFQRRSEDPK